MPTPARDERTSDGIQWPMGQPTAVARVGTGATLVAAAAAALLRLLDRDEWRGVAAIALGLLAVRTLGMLREVARRELPWTRLLVPVLVLVEGIGLWGRSTGLWQVRMATAVGLEATFLVVAVRELRRPSDLTVRIAAGGLPAGRSAAEGRCGWIETRIARAIAALLPPRVARLVAIELVILGSALAFPFRRRPVPAGFTYHRECGLRTLLLMLPLLVIGDVLLLELVVLPHAPLWLRVLVHGAAIYGALWLVGLYATLRARPHVIADGQLVMHRGILRSLAVPVADVATISALPTFADDWKQRAYCKGASRLDVSGATVLELRLHHPARPLGLLGDGAATTRVLVTVDDPAAFTAALQPRLASAS